MINITGMYKYSNASLLKEIVNDPDRKNFTDILREFLSLTFYYRELPLHYFSRYLYKKDINNVKDYFPTGFLSKIPHVFNEKLAKHVLDDKLFFSLFYGRYGISLPRLIAFNNKNFFTVGEKTTVIKNVGDFKDVMMELFRQNPSCNTFFIKKTYASSGGKNIYILSAGDLVSDDHSIGGIYSDIVSSAFVFHERVRQHAEMNRLNPASLNTIRFDTFTDKEGNTEIISGILKMSTTNVPVDNLSTGGCGVGVDLDAGRLRKTGFGKMKLYGARVLTEHPVTRVRFEGFSIPYLKEAIEMVVRAATLMPALRLVGWDVGISEDGPVLIEGNSDYGISANDQMYGGYRKNEIFKKVLHELEQL
jgi:hypothetical protein